MKNNKRGIIGSFISLFVATIVIVVILFIMIVGSEIVKQLVQRGDNFGVQSETATGLGDVFGYMDKQFDDVVRLRVLIEKGGGWESWRAGEMGK